MSAVIPDDNGVLHYYKLKEVSKKEYEKLRSPVAVEKEAPETRESLMKLKVVELKALAKTRGVSSSGRKADIVTRLLGKEDQGPVIPFRKVRDHYATIYVIDVDTELGEPDGISSERERILSNFRDGDLTPKERLGEILRQDLLDLEYVSMETSFWAPRL